MITSDQADKLGPPVAVLRAVGLKGVRFECRPMSRIPPDETIALLYERKGENFMQSGVGIFANGAWRRSIKGKPIEGDYLWTAMVDD